MFKGNANSFRILLLAVALCLTAVGGAKADSDVIVVDTIRLWAETDAGKDVHKQLNAFIKGIQDDLDASRDGLQKKAEALTKEKQSLQISEPAFAKRFRELQAEEIELQKRAQDSKVRFQVATARARSQFAQAVRPTLNDLLKKHKGAVLLEKGTLIVASPKVEITDEAIKAVNKKLSSLKVTLEPPAQDGAATAAKP